MTAISLPAAARRLDARQQRRLAALLLVVAAVVLYLAFRGTSTLPHDEEAGIFQWFNGLRDAIDESRATNPLFLYVIDPIRQVIDQLVAIVLDVLHGIGWIGVIGAAGVIGFLAGGWRVALLAVTGFASLGALGLWDESIDTLGLTLAAVALSLLIGIPLGILAGRNDRFQAFVNPILDVMQIMPAFAYLGIITLLLRIGGAAAAIATLIYAMPAAIRITSLAIRGVPGTTVEAAESLGATRSDLAGPAAARPPGDRPRRQPDDHARPGMGRRDRHRRAGARHPRSSGRREHERRRGVRRGIAIVIRRSSSTGSRNAGNRAWTPGDRSAGRRPTPPPDAHRRGGDRRSPSSSARWRSTPEQFPSAISVSFEDPINAISDWIKTNAFAVTDF